MTTKPTPTATRRTRWAPSIRTYRSHTHETCAEEGNRYTVDTYESDGTRETDDRRRYGLLDSVKVLVSLRTVEEEEEEDVESGNLLSTFFPSSKTDDSTELESVDSATIGTYDETLAEEGSRYTVDTHAAYGTRADVGFFQRRNRASSVSKDMLAKARNVGFFERRTVSDAPVKTTPQKTNQAGVSNKPAPRTQVKSTSPKAKKANQLQKKAPSAQVKPQAGVTNKPAPTLVKPTSPKAKKAVRCQRRPQLLRSSRHRRRPSTRACRISLHRVIRSSRHLRRSRRRARCQKRPQVSPSSLWCLSLLQ